ncbi:alanine--tRNA ligase [Mycoplasmatota bacterium zrk1]
MKKLTSNEIRKMWLDFFASKSHKTVESASLIPNNDPTLLWINSGVAAMKKYFDGSEKPTNPRMANSQKCIRTNDIENVGLTARHQTLFEMLGNFSIGDYFRKEAIEWACELLLEDKWFGLDKDLLYMTVYPDDQESYDLWIANGIDPSHIIKTDYNFWEIGEGPSGPCTEIFFDRGIKYGDVSIDVIRDDIENDRYIEIWNIVFSQFDANPKIPRSEYQELPQKNIDTGAGLERIVCVFQETETNFETDLFLPTIKEVEKLSGIEYNSQIAFKVIADHVRAVTFAIADGALLSNEGRGYVLRRILRRAIKHARTLGFKSPFMYNLVDIVVDNMGEHYTYLIDKVAIIKKVIMAEEEKFFETLDKGLKMIESIESKKISGKEAFTLYDTYGFPIELTLEYAEENNLEVDIDEFNNEMEKQRERARSARTNDTSMNTQNEEFLNFDLESEFVGYENLEYHSKIIAVFDEGIVFNKTPFYAESGGQSPDKGTFTGDGFFYNVIDVQKMPNGQFLHSIEIKEGNPKVGQTGEAKVSLEMRKLTMFNHSGTHLLFKVLRDELGSHVGQSGSQVSKTNLRFDFNNYDSLTDEQILMLEKKVNEVISQGLKVTITEETLDRAREMGAIAEFGEKYGEYVRVVNMGDYTLDLCGGTHVENTSEIEKLAITSVESKGSGIFRVEALTNVGVDNIKNYVSVYDNEMSSLLEKASKLVNEAKSKGISIDFDYKINNNYIGSYQDVINKRNELDNLKELVKELDKKIKREVEKLALSDLSLFDEFIEGDKLIAKVSNYDNGVLKQIVDSLLDKLGNGFVFIANIVEDKVVFVAKSNNDVHCGNVVKEAAVICGGNGGGRPNIAQAGGKDISKVDEAIERVKEIV